MDLSKEMLFMIIVFILFLPSLISGTLNIKPTEIKGGAIVTMNITLNNTWEDNVTELNVILPDNLTFIGNSNGSTVFAIFSNTTSRNISWSNSTLLVENGSTQYFWFNVSVDSVTGNYNILLSITFENGSKYDENMSVFIDSNSPIIDYSIDKIAGINKATNIHVSIIDENVNNVTLLIIDKMNLSIQLSNNSILLNIYNSTHNKTNAFLNYKWNGFIVNITNGTKWNYTTLILFNNTNLYYVKGMFRKNSSTFIDNAYIAFYSSNLSFSHVVDENFNKMDIENGISNFTVYLLYISGEYVKNMSTETFTLYNTTGNPLIKLVKAIDGNYTIKISASDNVGNNNVSTVVVYVDNTPPSIYVSSPLNKTYTSKWIFLNLSVNENSTCKFSVDNSSNTSMIENGSYWIYNLTGIEDGNHKITFYCEDMLNNMNVSSVWFTIDTSPPDIVLVYPSNGNWYASGDIVFKYNVSDLSTISNCSLWITNYTNENFSENKTNESIVVNGTNNFTVILSSGENENAVYTWAIKCYDEHEFYSFSENRTLYVGNRSDLIVNSITFNPTSPYHGINVIVNVSIKNVGDRKNINYTRIKFCFAKNSNPCSDSNRYENTSVVVPPLNSNETFSVVYNVSVNNGDGLYYTYAEIDYTNNDTMERSDFNGGTNSLLSFFSTYLNISLLNITYLNQSLGMARPGENITIKLKVTYFNGSAVSTLTVNNFTSKDKWVNGSTDYRSGYKVYESDFSQKSSGIYILNYTVVGMKTSNNNIYAEYGLHKINISIKANNYIGYKYIDYNIKSGYLKVFISGLKSTLQQDSNGNIKGDLFDVYVENVGNDYLYSLSVSIYDNGSADFDISPTTCSLSSLSPKQNAIICDDVSAGADKVGHYKVWVYAYGNDTIKNTYKAYTEDFVYVEPYTQEGDQQTGASAPPSCNKDSDCPSTYYCDNGICKQISCENGFISNHKCIPYIRRIEIVNIVPYNVSIIQGDANETRVLVKNTGNLTVEAILSVSFKNEKLSFDVPAKKTLLANEEGEFIVGIEAEKDCDIGIFDVTFKVYDSIHEDVYDEKDVKILVLPSEDTKENILMEFLNLKKLFDTIKDFFSKIKIDSVSIVNYSKVNRTYNSILSLIERINGSIEKNDYITANVLSKDLRDMINKFNLSVKLLSKEAEEKEAEKFSQTIFIVLIVLISVSIIGILAYMLLPTETGYRPRYGFVRTKKHGMKYRLTLLKEKLHKMFKTIAHLHRRITKQTTILDFEKPHVYGEIKYMKGYKKYKPSYIYKPIKKKKRLKI